MLLYIVFITLAIFLTIRFVILRKKDKRQGKEVRSFFRLFITFIFLWVVVFLVIPLVFGLIGAGMGGTVGPEDIPPVF